MNGASASRMVRGLFERRWVLDAMLLGAFSLVMAELGPYRTLDAPHWLRIAYWFLAVFVSGAAVIGADRALERRIVSFWPRIGAISLMITLPVTLYIYWLNALMLDLPRRWWLWPQLAWQVLVVMLLLATLRGLLWRRVVETRTLVMPPLPEAEREFRMHLSARRRMARLIALEAEDHYIRVHTDMGSELVGMRFADALEELKRAHGFRIHRSWWVAADAIEAVRWSRGGGEARLSGGIVAPVSRRNAATLREAGWR